MCLLSFEQFNVSSLNKSIHFFKIKGSFLPLFFMKGFTNHLPNLLSITWKNMKGKWHNYQPGKALFTFSLLNNSQKCELSHFHLFPFQNTVYFHKHVVKVKVKEEWNLFSVVQIQPKVLHIIFKVETFFN